MSGESHYTGWYIKSNISYGDYLQGKEFERSIRYGIDDQTKQLIASNEQLAREHYEALEHISDGINSGFTILSTDIARLQESVDSGFQQIATIFEWGFSEMLVSLGRVNDSLDALIKIAKTPAQTWAYEQFEITRDEFRRGLYHESFESVLRAINGFGSNPGYKTEFRFHFLQGTIRLGSFKNSDPQLVDPLDAEAADAYNYEKDFNAEASKENIFGYVHAAKLAREGKNVIQSVVASFKSISSNLINEEQRKLEHSIATIDSEINEIRSTIANIDSEISSSKPRDYEATDLYMATALLIALLSIYIPGNIIRIIVTVIVGIIILYALTGGAIILLLIPPAKLVYFVRKIIWKTEESRAQSRKQQLRQTVGTKAEPQKQQLQQKISDLQAIKSRIASFTMQG